MLAGTEEHLDPTDVVAGEPIDDPELLAAPLKPQLSASGPSRKSFSSVVQPEPRPPFV